MTRTNLLNPGEPSSFGKLSSARSAAGDALPKFEGPQVALPVAAFPFEQDPCPQHPGERATVHTLSDAHRTARRLHVSLWRVTEADVAMTPGACSEGYIAWLAVPANMAMVVEERRGRMQQLITPAPNLEDELALERDRRVRAEAALRTLHARGEIWTTHYNGGVRTVGRSIVDVTGEALGEEVGRG